MGDEPRGDWALVDSGNGYGHVLETARQRMSIRKIKRNTRSGSTAVDERVRMNKPSTRKTKGNRNKEMI